MKIGHWREREKEKRVSMLKRSGEIWLEHVER
jgi:hypothetical protein